MIVLNSLRIYEPPSGLLRVLGAENVWFVLLAITLALPLTPAVNLDNKVYGYRHTFRSDSNI